MPTPYVWVFVFTHGLLAAVAAVAFAELLIERRARQRTTTALRLWRVKYAGLTAGRVSDLRQRQTGGRP